MVLHVGDQHLVARLHLRLAERGGHQVDSLRRAPREDDLLRLAGIDKLAHRLAGRLVQVGGLLRQVVYAPVDVGVDVQILFAHGVEHAQRLLCRRRIVKVDQRSAVHLSPQYRKVFTYLIYIIHILNSLLLNSSLTQHTSLTLVQLAAEALLDEIVQAVAQRLELHLVDDLVDEGILQQQFRLLQ